MVVWMLITKLTLEPFDYVRKKIERCYHDSRMATPVQSSNGFLVPYPPKKCAKSNGVSFSSDGMYWTFMLLLQAYWVLVCWFVFLNPCKGRDDRNRQSITISPPNTNGGIQLRIQYFLNYFTNRYHWQSGWVFFWGGEGGPWLGNRWGSIGDPFL